MVLKSSSLLTGPQTGEKAVVRWPHSPGPGPQPWSASTGSKRWDFSLPFGHKRKDTPAVCRAPYKTSAPHTGQPHKNRAPRHTAERPVRVWLLGTEIRSPLRCRSSSTSAAFPSLPGWADAGWNPCRRRRWRSWRFQAGAPGRPLPARSPAHRDSCRRHRT